MSVQTAKFFKGMTTGLIIGAAVTMMTDPITDRQRRRIVKKTEGAFKNMGEMIDSAIELFR